MDIMIMSIFSASGDFSRDLATSVLFVEAPLDEVCRPGMPPVRYREPQMPEAGLWTLPRRRRSRAGVLEACSNYHCLLIISLPAGWKGMGIF